MRTFVGSRKKEIWICCALCRQTGRVVAFAVGRRTMETLRAVIRRVLALSPAWIYTDRLALYARLVPGRLHKTQRRCTNRIERLHLTLRTRLKRLSRRSACFSRRAETLGHCVRLCLWRFPAVPAPAIFARAKAARNP